MFMDNLELEDMELVGNKFIIDHRKNGFIMD